MDTQLAPGTVIEGRHFGVDEAGRGAMAGPLAVAAVAFPWAQGPWQDELRDSKLLSVAKRESLCARITTWCQYACVMIDAAWIDAHGIDAAETEGLLRVIMQLSDGGRQAEDFIQLPETIILDGTPQTWGLQKTSIGQNLESRLAFMIKGDKYVLAISAASIVAKTLRDAYMKTEAHNQYPCYNFFSHVGYVTQEHLDALEKFGPCQIHRKSFAPVRRNIERSMITNSSS
jgi:ribonuclease HII